MLALNGFIDHYKGFGKADLTQLRVCVRWFFEKVEGDADLDL